MNSTTGSFRFSLNDSLSKFLRKHFGNVPVMIVQCRLQMMILPGLFDDNRKPCTPSPVIVSYNPNCPTLGSLFQPDQFCWVGSEATSSDMCLSSENVYNIAAFLGKIGCLNIIKGGWEMSPIYDPRMPWMNITSFVEDVFDHCIMKAINKTTVKLSSKCIKNVMSTVGVDTKDLQTIISNVSG